MYEALALVYEGLALVWLWHQASTVCLLLHASRVISHGPASSACVCMSACVLKEALACGAWGSARQQSHHQTDCACKTVRPCCRHAASSKAGKTRLIIAGVGWRGRTRESERERALARERRPWRERGDGRGRESRRHRILSLDMCVKRN